METIIETWAVEKCESDESGVWYNVEVELSVNGGPFISGSVSIGDNLKALGSSAREWVSRSIYNAMEPLVSPKFKEVADLLEARAADCVSDWLKSQKKSRP